MVNPKTNKKSSSNRGVWALITRESLYIRKLAVENRRIRKNIFSSSLDGKMSFILGIFDIKKAAIPTRPTLFEFKM